MLSIGTEVGIPWYGGVFIMDSPTHTLGKIQSEETKSEELLQAYHAIVGRYRLT